MIEIASEMKELRIRAGLKVRDVLAGYPDKRMTKGDYSRMEAGITAFPPALAAHLRRLAAEKGERPAAIIADLIPAGKRNAIKRYELRAVASMSDREMRRAIQEDRQNGYPICNDQDGEGYYMAETERERERLKATQMARAREIMRSVEMI